MVVKTLRCARVLQLTLAVIKPDAVAHPLIVEALHQNILENNFVIVRKKDLMWKRSDSEKFYAEHEGRFFYQRLVEFMSSGPMRAYILAREDAITHWRELMGPTKVYRARYTTPNSMRAQYGLTDTRNTTHGSVDSTAASRRLLISVAEHTNRLCVNRADKTLYDQLEMPCAPTDSEESAKREIAFFFPEFSIEQWLQKEEPCFRVGQMEYDQQKQIHTSTKDI